MINENEKTEWVINFDAEKDNFIFRDERYKLFETKMIGFSFLADFKFFPDSKMKIIRSAEKSTTDSDVYCLNAFGNDICEIAVNSSFSSYKIESFKPSKKMKY